MTSAEYAARSQVLLGALRDSNRPLWFVLEVGRRAAAMALVLCVADLVDFGIFPASPARRLGFLVSFAVVMTMVETAIRPRAPVPTK